MRPDKPITHVNILLFNSSVGNVTKSISICIFQSNEKVIGVLDRCSSLPPAGGSTTSVLSPRCHNVDADKIISIIIFAIVMVTIDFNIVNFYHPNCVMSPIVEVSTPLN